MKKLLIWLIAILLVIGGLARLAIAFPFVQDALIARVMQVAMSRAAAGIPQPESLQAFVCGSASPLPAPGRAQACMVVMTPQHLFVVDSGAGSTARIMEAQLPLQRLQGVLITHMHSDHIAEIPELNLVSWVAGRPLPLQVYGPEGIRQLVSGLNRAYKLDRSYRVAHHGEELMKPNLGIPAAETIEPGVIIQDGDLTVTAYLAEHDPIKPAYGYRFDYRGRSLVISGDSNVSEQTHKVAKGVDLLFHDALSVPIVSAMATAARAEGLERNAKILEDIIDYHASVDSLIDLNRKTPIKMVALYHLVPAPQNYLMEQVFLRSAPGNFVLTNDRDWFELPVGSREILIR